MLSIGESWRPDMVWTMSFVEKLLNLGDLLGCKQGMWRKCRNLLFFGEYNKYSRTWRTINVLAARVGGDKRPNRYAFQGQPHPRSWPYLGTHLSLY